MYIVEQLVLGLQTQLLNIIHLNQFKVYCSKFALRALDVIVKSLTTFIQITQYLVLGLKTQSLTIVNRAAFK